MLKNVSIAALFRSRIATLLLSSVTAQLLPIATMPILSRLFVPGDFGVLGVYLATVAVLSVAGSLRLEHAVLLEQDPRDAETIARRCLQICLFTGCIVASALGLAHAAGLSPSRLGLSVTAYYAIPIGMAVSSLIQVQSVRLLRSSSMTHLARGRVVQAVATSGFGLFAGMLWASADSLVLSTLTGQLIGLWVLTPSTENRAKLARGFGQLWARYRRFTLYTLPSDLLSAGSAQLPTFFLAATFGTAAAGAFLLAQRVLLLPLSMLGSAVTDVFKADASRLEAEGYRWRELTLRMLLGLSITSVLPCSVVVLWAPELFASVFGSEWRAAGEICQLLVISAFVRLAATPISYNFYLARRQREDLLVQGYGLLSNAVIFGAAGVAGWALQTCILAYAINATMIYVYYAVRSVVLSATPRTHIELSNRSANKV